MPLINPSQLPRELRRKLEARMRSVIDIKSIRVDLQSAHEEIKSQAIEDMVRLETLGDLLPLSDLVAILVRNHEAMRFAIEHAATAEERDRMLALANDDEFEELLERIIRALERRAA